jgi:prepilin peptidase CpaA
MLNRAPLLVALILAAVAGWTDWRYRRIPNWLTVPCFFLGIGANALAGGWYGTKQALLGAGLGLLLLLPFVLLRSLGAGDWKLMGAVGACIGLHGFVTVLILTVLINGLVALGMVIASGRLGRTVRNMFRLLGAMLTFNKPAEELTLDSPDAVKVPFGVSAAIAVAIYVIRHGGGLH